MFWSHRIVLAAVSPLFLKPLLLGSERDDGNSVLTLHLPQVAPAHVRLVLDYVYTGAMYLRADQGACPRPFNPAVGREDSFAHGCWGGGGGPSKTDKARDVASIYAGNRVTKWATTITVRGKKIDSYEGRLNLDRLFKIELPPLKLAGVVRLFEMLQMKCGVSVSKMVAVEERAKGGGGGGRARKKSGPSKTTKWVQQAEFQGRNSLENTLTSKKG